MSVGLTTPTILGRRSVKKRNHHSDSWSLSHVDALQSFLLLLSFVFLSVHSRLERYNLYVLQRLPGLLLKKEMFVYHRRESIVGRFLSSVVCPERTLWRRRRHCAKCVTAAVRAVEQSLSLSLPPPFLFFSPSFCLRGLLQLLLLPCLSFGPVCLPTGDQTQIQFSRPRSPRTTIYSFKQTLFLSLSLLFSFRRSPASRLPVEHRCWRSWERREFQHFQIAHRSSSTVKSQTFFRSFCTGYCSESCAYVFLLSRLIGVEWM